MDLDYAALGKRIRTIRKKKQMTQEYLAEQVGIEPSNISHIERAASKVGLGTLVKIANALQCSVDDLLCDSILCEREAFENQLLEISKDCTPKELRMLADLAQAMKDSMRRRGYDTSLSVNRHQIRTKRCGFFLPRSCKPGCPILQYLYF